MLEIAVASYFRDSQKWHGRRIDQVDSYFGNIEREICEAGLAAKYFLLEGDSTDDTWDVLCKYRDAMPGRVSLTKRTVGNSKHVASVECNIRFRQLSEIGNVVLRQARDSGSGLVFWIESDLVPQNGLLRRLMESVSQPWWNETLAVAPLAVFRSSGRMLHYDTWGMTGIRGEKWGNGDLDRMANYGGRYRPMSSVGSCALMNAYNLRAHDLDFGEGCFPELCRRGRNAGLKLWCDTEVSVRHPSTELVASRLI